MKALLFFALAISVYGSEVQTLIDTAYKNNPTLKKLELQIQSNEYNIKNSTLYKNPVFSIGMNDINIDEPSDRTLEPMQTQYISISQEITDSDKLEQKEQIIRINKKILQRVLKDKKDQIAKDIYSIAFSINELEKKIKLNQDKIKNTQKIKNYHSNNLL
jgi:outer membrane protein TolC